MTSPAARMGPTRCAVVPSIPPATSMAQRQAAAATTPGWFSKSLPNLNPGDLKAAHPRFLLGGLRWSPQLSWQNSPRLMQSGEVVLQFQPVCGKGLLFCFRQLKMLPRKLNRLPFLCFAIVGVALLSHNIWAATESTVYSFTGGLDGSNPASQLIFDAAGNAYGTTVTGGSSNCGTVFELTPSGGGHYQQRVLLSFDCFSTGKNPYGGVTMDAQGNLYGTTAAGGSAGICSGDGCGVVFKLT